MKRSLLLIAVGFILFSCGNEGGKIVKHPKRDSSLTLAMYLGYRLKGIEFGPARKIVIDTLVWVGKDSATMKKEWTTITEYDVEVNIAIRDSASAKAFGINSTDTVIRRLLKADAKYVRDGITNWDSAMAQLKQYMDTTKQKVDTTRK
jgi:hypothetical protein